MRSICRLILIAAVCGGCMRNVNENVIRVEVDRMLGKYVWVERVAVIPFDGTREGRQTVFGINKKWPKGSGMVVAGLFANEMAKIGRFQVKSPSTVKEELEKVYSKPVSGYLSPSEVKEMGSALKADALVVGDVIEFCAYHLNTLKQSRVRVRMKMIDAHTGKTMWTGDFRLDDREPPYDLAKKGCEQIITQLRERMSGKRE